MFLLAALFGVGAIVLLGGPIGWTIGVLAIWSNGVLANFSSADEAPPIAVTVGPLAGLAAVIATIVGAVT